MTQLGAYQHVRSLCSVHFHDQVRSYDGHFMSSLKLAGDGWESIGSINSRRVLFGMHVVVSSACVPVRGMPLYLNLEIPRGQQPPLPHGSYATVHPAQNQGRDRHVVINHGSTIASETLPHYVLCHFTPSWSWSSFVSLREVVTGICCSIPACQFRETD